MPSLSTNEIQRGDLVLVECNVSRYQRYDSAAIGEGSRSRPSPSKRVRLEDNYVPALTMVSISLLAKGAYNEDNKPRDIGISFSA